MPKIYVLDTNVLLHNPTAIYAFADNHIVIPFAVIEEIDNHKKTQDEVGRHARQISRELDSLRAFGHLSKGIPLDNGGRLWIELNHQEVKDFPLGLDIGKCDNRILAVAYNLNLQGSEPVILVTKDLNLRIKADVLGLQTEDFHSDKVDYDALYRGSGELCVSAGELEMFFEDGKLGFQEGNGFLPNCFVVLRNAGNPSQSALGRYRDRALFRLHHSNSSNWGVKPRNKE